ncbi:MAG: type II toxin-antitoxin system VapC family toxin [Candidatus Bathyarchaeia archaeon]
MTHYIDTNVWIYAIIAHPKYGAKCREILEDIEVGSLKAIISTQVLSEVAGVLYRQYQVKDTTRQITAIISYPLEIATVTPDTILRAAEHARDYEILPYDGIHVAAATEHMTTKIISADRELDKVDFIQRIDPFKYGKLL